ncbi:MAG: TonB-dependent receptor [Cyclobacteriaceae bacterium]|nr:TonB-dependent receptor [Cyclobacteriaceae bacterium]
MRRILLLIVFVTLGVTNAFAQTRTIQGKVTDAENGQGLPGVNVVVQGTARGTTTDVDGVYTIELAAAENTLNFTFVGYKTQTVQVGERTTINIALEVDVLTLEDIVVIGYGTVKKSDLTGSVSSMKGNDLNKIPAASPVLALQGKIPGVQITTASGAPGAGAIVRIRGVGTFNNASPIYVVDGVILDNIDFLNSGDIQSIEVLKDASATAIYGSRGANGVVMVTTKKGVMGQEYPTISVNADYSVQSLTNRIDLLSGREFAIIANEINPGSYNNVDAVPNTDWQDLLFQTAPIQNYQISAAGASAKIQYYVGIGYFNQKGIIPKSNYERLTIKLNNTYHLSKNVRFGNNLAFTPYSQQNTNNNSVFVVYRAQPTVNPYQPDGSYSPVPGVGNVLADLEYTNSYGKGIRSVGNFYTEVDFLKYFTFKSSFGVDFSYGKSKSFTPVFYVDPQQQNSTSDLNKSFGDNSTWLWENTINYTRNFGKSSLNAVVGYTMQETASEFISASGENILRDGEDFWYLDPGNIVPTTVNNGVSDDLNYSMISYLFRANYTYDRKYLLTVTYRRDGSSKFSKDNRFADFPSVALGWNVINENFLNDVAVLSNFKVRGSWGVIGNEKTRYDRRYSSVLNGVGGVFGAGEIYTTGSTYGPSGNPNLKWESTYQTDIGVELGFLEDKLTAEIDYYNKRTEDILIDLPVPGYLGNGDGASITYNAAEVLNKGIELNLGWNDEILGGLKYRIGAIATTIHNEALKVKATGGEGDYQPNGAGTTRTSVGLPLGAFYGYVVDGVFQNQAELDAYPHLSIAEVGDVRFVDTNKDGVLNGNDRTYIGSPIPKVLYGLNLEGAYKGFSLSIDFQGQQGNKIYNAKETVRPALYNFEQHVFDRWTGEGTSNTEPRSSAGGYNFLPSTRFIQDGSFFRLRSISLAYGLPQQMIEKIHFKSAQVYVRGTNLFTVTKFTGYTPEVSSGSVLDNGIDSGGYPIPSVYSVGFNVTF